MHRPFRIDGLSDTHRILVSVQLQEGVLDVGVPRQRLYSSTTYIFVLWMVGSSMVLFAVATMFMRNQVRALRRLAHAAESFGKGRHVANFKLEGATEIRQAAAAFIVMRDRIQRQISQRTEMLAGVSHDLRTPLTRMKLALELVGDGLAIDELRSDVADMEKMVQGYLDFARGEGSEVPIEVDLSGFLEEIVAASRRDGMSISLTAPAEYNLLLRPNAMKRCIGNLVSNARRHGSHIWLTALPGRGAVDIMIDDDGPDSGQGTGALARHRLAAGAGRARPRPASRHSSRRRVANQDAARRIVAVFENLGREVEEAQHDRFLAPPPQKVDRCRLPPVGRVAAAFTLRPELVPQRLDDAVEDESGGILPAALEQDVGEPAACLIHLEINTKRIIGEGLIAQHDIAIAVAEDDRRAQAQRASAIDRGEVVRGHAPVDPVPGRGQDGRGESDRENAEENCGGPAAAPLGPAISRPPEGKGCLATN